MAIERIPGVGPTNSDIAATIATTPAVSAQITANVPTAAAIATAVAAPSLAQITTAITSNAASAGVTMAAITSSIIANAASAGLTVAAITSAGNSAGWGTTGGETWTVLVNGGTTGASGLNLTGLSGYKKYKLVIIGAGSTSDADLRVQINGITSGYWSGGLYADQNNQYSTVGSTNSSYSLVTATSCSATVYAEFIIEQANLTGYKAMYCFQNGFNASGFPRTHQFYGCVYSNPTLSSIYFYRSAGTWNQGYYTLYGGN